MNVVIVVPVNGRIWLNYLWLSRVLQKFLLSDPLRRPRGKFLHKLTGHIANAGQ